MWCIYAAANWLGIHEIFMYIHFYSLWLFWKFFIALTCKWQRKEVMVYSGIIYQKQAPWTTWKKSMSLKYWKFHQHWIDVLCPSKSLGCGRTRSSFSLGDGLLPVWHHAFIKHNAGLGQLDPLRQTKYIDFHWRKCIWSYFPHHCVMHISISIVWHHRFR